MSLVFLCLSQRCVEKERAMLCKISTDLLCSFNGIELVLALRATHIAKRSAVCNISSNEGDLIHCMLEYCCLERSKQGNS